MRGVDRNALPGFLGLTAVSESFAFNARSEDEFAIYFDEVPGETPIWAVEGYAIYVVADPDFEPASTVLLRHEGQTVGFYAGGLCWIDPEHRGKGFSIPLIVAANLIHGAVPYDKGKGMGFSRAGMAAHQAAHRWTVERAAEFNLQVPPEVAAEILPLSTPAPSI